MDCYTNNFSLWKTQVPIIPPDLRAVRLAELAIVATPGELPGVLAVLRRVVGPVAYRRLALGIMARRAAP